MLCDDCQPITRPTTTSPTIAPLCELGPITIVPVLYLEDAAQADVATRFLAELVSGMPLGSYGGARIGIVSNIAINDLSGGVVVAAKDEIDLAGLLSAVSAMSDAEHVSSLSASSMGQAILAAAGIDGNDDGDGGADWCQASFDAGFCSPFIRPACGVLQSVSHACPYTCSGCAEMTPSTCVGRTLQFTDADNQTRACRCAADCHTCSYSSSGHGSCSRVR